MIRLTEKQEAGVLSALIERGQRLLKIRKTLFSINLVHLPRTVSIEVKVLGPNDNDGGEWKELIALETPAIRDGSAQVVRAIERWLTQKEATR